MGQKSLGFGENLGYRLYSGTISPHSVDLLSTTHFYDCTMYYVLVHFIRTILFVLSAMADQRMH